jgi:hypothetical protein
VNFEETKEFNGKYRELNDSLFHITKRNMPHIPVLSRMAIFMTYPQLKKSLI